MSASQGESIDTSAQSSDSTNEGGLLDLLGLIESRSDVPGPLQQQGFVAFNRMAGSLGTLQQRCRDEVERRPSMNCMTVRYAINSGDAFGTLIAALLGDMVKIAAGVSPAELAGFFGPAPGDARWRELAGHFTPLRTMAPTGSMGTFSSGYVADLLGTLYGESVLPSGWRLVIFLEVYGADGDPDAVREWYQAHEILFHRLPERLGIVVSGVPQGFDIPRAPHFIEIDLADTSGASDGPTATTYRYTDAPLHSDRPTAQDDLGMEAYADALARFVLHKQTTPPLTVGIHGKWGKGKSSFMEMIDTALARSVVSTDEIPVPRIAQLMVEKEGWGREPVAKKRVLTVRFNAWQFQDATQTWAGLAHVVSEAMEKALPRWRRAVMRIAYAWNRRRWEMMTDLVPPLLIVLLVILFFSVVPGAWDQARKLYAPAAPAKEGADKDDAILSLLKVLLPAGSLVALGWPLASRLVKTMQPVSDRIAAYIKPYDHKAQMGYQHKVLEDLQFVHHHLKKHCPECKVVVYVDDLDRCSDEKIMEILQAVNLILANCDFFVFLGMDTEMIHRAIRAHYTRKEEKLPVDFPDNYLRKIVQLSFHLPEAGAGKLFDLVGRLFSERSRQGFSEARTAKGNGGEKSEEEREHESVDGGALRFDMARLRRPVKEEEVMDTPEELEAFYDYQIYLEDNPREIKRLVNVHRLVKILLQRAFTSWSHDRQRHLVKWLIFCARWPHLVDDLIVKARELPDAEDCLELVVTDARQPHGTTLGMSDTEAELLMEFGTKGGRFSSAVCREFTLAAQISQMVRLAPAPSDGAAAKESATKQ